MVSWFQDFRYALRSLGKRPGFAALTIAILTLGLGATVTLFSVVRAVLLAPLPFAEPERLVRLYQAYPERQLARGSISRLNAEDWIAGSQTVERLGLYSTLPDGLVLRGQGEPTQFPTSYVSGDFFATLGISAAQGRLLTAEDERGNDRVVVLSDACFRRRFGSDPSLVGRTLNLDGQPMTVIGIAPPSLRFPSPRVEAWALLSLIPERSIPRIRPVRWLSAIGRLAPGVTVDQAASELSNVAAALAERYPEDNAGATAVTVAPLRDEMVGEVRPAVLALMVAVVVLLGIGCANVASLLLARGLSRQRELAIAAALGASRARLVTQLLTESFVLALAGAGLGILGAAWASDALPALAAGMLPRAEEVHIDGGILLFGLAAAVATCLASGLLPALRLVRGAAASPSLRVGGALAAATQGRLRGALVAAQVALALILLAGSALALKSLALLARVDAGFDPQGLVTVNLTIPDDKYPEREDYLGVGRSMLERVRALPGVAAAATIKTLTLSGGHEVYPFTVEGEPEPAAGVKPLATVHPVSTGLFSALGVPLIAGRDFTAADRGDATTVVIVSQTLARRYLPAGDPIGRRLRFGDGTAEIIGVAGDVRHDGLAEEPTVSIYLHQEQMARRVLTFVVRSAGRPASLAGAVMQAIRAVEPGQPISRVETGQELLGGALAPPRFFSLVSGALAATALLLAACGIYGVVSFLVSQRVREIGLRMAVGAEPHQVLRLVVGRGMVWVMVGLAIGSALALALARLAASRVSGWLYGVAAFDAASLLAAFTVLFAAALLACYLPGRRAARLDPVVALRTE